MTVIIFLIVLAILIFVHELGHFLFAIRAGIRVDEFALGFGPKIFSIKRGETTYKLNLIPFGGYVKIFGENPDDESMTGIDSKRSFVNASKFNQVLVLFAGVLFNFIFAFILFSIAFSIGTLTSRESYSQYTNYISNPEITVTYIEPNSPAYKSGLRVGDNIISAAYVDKEYTNFDSIDSVKGFIAKSNGQEISLKINRNSKDEVIKVIPSNNIIKDEMEKPKYAIGIAMNDTVMLKLPLHLAIYEGFRFTLHIMKETIVGIYDLVAGSFSGKSSLSSVTGPVGIAGMVGDAAKMGFTYLITFTALISINLGIINLIPFPALDGGRIFFVIIESIIRKPIKPVLANTLNTIGFGLLMLLIIFVTYKDIAKLVQ